ncbi:IS110 family transposase [Methylocystis sp.]|uniref:IS110 family transposase n=1 Tax=Methylocystis sp. TaxID=1911079 RepID=UPI003DA561A5
MEYYAGSDVSSKESSVCVVDTAGKVVREVKVASEPEALVRYFDELGLPVSCIGLEAGPLSQWLHAGLMAAGRDAVLLETRHVKAALSATTVKTDRKDARGIAQLLRTGLVSPGSREIGALQGYPRPSRRAQALARQASRCRTQHSRHSAGLRAQGRRGQPGTV